MRSMMALLLIANLAHAASAAAADTSVELQRQIILGGPGGWDYLTFDPAANRLFISRADRVLVMNALDGSVVSTIPNTQGVHGVTLAPSLGQGFISDGRADTVTVFDLHSFATLRTIPVNGHNPDAILYDEASKRIYTFNGASHDISVIDPLKDAVVATIPVGGKPEFAVSDSAGHIFFNIEDTSQLSEIDAPTAKRIATWPLTHCDSPSGLALDITHQRLFSVCDNAVLVVTDATSGRHVAEVPIGKGADAAAFDAERGLVFSSNGRDGTLTVIHEDDPDHYSVLATVSTQKSARTMALDAKSHRVYLVAAEFGPAPAPSADQPRPRPTVLDGTFKVLVVGY
jgi:YVTN family beta-propeller protein